MSLFPSKLSHTHFPSAPLHAREKVDAGEMCDRTKVGRSRLSVYFCRSWPKIFYGELRDVFKEVQWCSTTKTESLNLFTRCWLSEGVKASLSMGLSQKLVSSVDFMIQQLEVFFEARRRSFDSLNDTRYPMCNRIRTIAANVRDRRSFLLLII